MSAPTRKKKVPAWRRLRAYAFDPSASVDLDTALLNEVVMKVEWEEVDPGPVGEYLEVVDYDPSSKCLYEPVNLSDDYLLAEDGLTPSEGNPQFHQQMVYGVAMTTILHFERALGRPVFFAEHRTPKKGGGFDVEFGRRLRIYPHAIRGQNAYYSPDKRALLFGYFPAEESNARVGRQMKHYPGGWVFTCLSHDIVAHEMTHALLDGLHHRYIENTQLDSLAFHEAFADIVALFQHFTMKEVLAAEIARTRGDIAGSENMLGKLAIQFGEATGRHGALRDGIGTVDKKTNVWRRKNPDPLEIERITTPHERGAILVSAVFDAFLAIYRRRTADLYRIATSGTGVLPQGEIHPDLVGRLAEEASRAAGHVLQICIRALDYCPPVDINFGDYLRALITSDCDVVAEDDLLYRVAFIEAFRRRGIYPRSVRTLSVDTLRWPGAMSIGDADVSALAKLLSEKLIRITRYENSREGYWNQSKELAATLHEVIRKNPDVFGKVLDRLIVFQKPKKGSLPEGLRTKGDTPSFEVLSVRPAERVGPGDIRINHAVVLLTQTRELPVDPKKPDAEKFLFRGGATLIFDLEKFELLYVIGKPIDDDIRLKRQQEYLLRQLGGADLAATYSRRMLTPTERGGEPFALLHQSAHPEAL